MFRLSNCAYRLFLPIERLLIQYGIRVAQRWNNTNNLLKTNSVVMSGLFGFLGDGSCCILDECYVREQMITMPGGLANSFSPDYGRECRDWSRISRRFVLGRPLLPRDCPGGISR
ncbi:hypothetical protein SSCH_810015 [Syntrophaceticus schinkii]|uniref:Uncharacterized protein n=1 Tax=Syntrophaceticus schinkii TaxID=499207 RepID=A0A0B7MRQ2_9FIRM|nr:hypothetical protein SSCH_810015 [Syntrophaceticus schinkii]